MHLTQKPKWRKETPLTKYIRWRCKKLRLKILLSKNFAEKVRFFQPPLQLIRFYSFKLPPILFYLFIKAVALRINKNLVFYSAIINNLFLLFFRSLLHYTFFLHKSLPFFVFLTTLSPTFFRFCVACFKKLVLAQDFKFTIKFITIYWFYIIF